MPIRNMSKTPTTAVVASDGLGIDRPPTSGFDCFSEKWYDDRGDQGEDDSPPLEEEVDEEESRSLLKFVAEKADALPARRAAVHIKTAFPNLFQMYKESSPSDVPQWADRKKMGIKHKAPEWMRTYYGNKSGGEGWDACGFKLSMLFSLDRNFYDAFYGYLRRLKEKGTPVPDDFRVFEGDNPSSEDELQMHGIVEPEDALRLFKKDDPKKAARLYQAARRITQS